MAKRLVRTIPAVIALTCGFVASADAKAPPPNRAPVSGVLPLYFAERPATDGSRRMLPAEAEVPVTIELASPPTAADVSALRALGAHVKVRRNGEPRGFGRYLLADLPATSVNAVAALSRVVRIEPDGAPFDAPAPLSGTALEIEATAMWRAAASDGSRLTGQGVTICNIDHGIDHFHPLFFRADGGYVAWVDADGDGAFTPGVDGVDMDGDGQPAALRVLNTTILSSKDKPLFSSEDPALDVGLDFLYVDANGNGERDFGPDAGFTEADPTYGERLFAVDDVNGNGTLETGERLVALGSSKISAVRYNKKTYRRGKNLIDLPMKDQGISDVDHGTAASGILVAGNIGLTRHVGIAPGADLVMVVRSSTPTKEEVAYADFCIDEGARVVLHEYAPWLGRHLDGSSPLEALIDDSVKQGIVHVNPAGNLSGSKKLYKGALAAGATSEILVEAPPKSPYGAFAFFGVSLLWRDPSRALSVTLEDPTGASKVVTVGANDVPLNAEWSPGLRLYSVRTDSTRGTARVDVYVRDDGTASATVPLGTWKLRVTDPTPAGSSDLPIVAYAMDELSGWGLGIHFPDGYSEDHLICFPATADHGIAVAAYSGHAWFSGEQGARASYSGRGRRIDGEPILWISAPADPITAGFTGEAPAVDRVFGGTSGASPHVAGAAALLIQADPARSGDDVREAIKRGALVDEHVGAAPNDDYGHGKLRIYESLFGEAPPGGAPPSIAVKPATVEAGEQALVPIDVADPDEPAGSLVIEVDREYDGEFEERLTSAELPVAFDEVGARVIKLRVTDSTGRQAFALADVDVVPAAKEPPPAPSVKPGGGCVAAGSGEAPEPGAFALGWAALLGLSRVRRRKN